MKNIEINNEVHFLKDESIHKHLETIYQIKEDIFVIEDTNTKNNIRVYIRFLNDGIKGSNFIFKNKEYQMKHEIIIITNDKGLKHGNLDIIINNERYVFIDQKCKYIWVDKSETPFFYLISDQKNFCNDCKKEQKHKDMRIIGHRGIGMNKYYNEIYYRENTIGSFNIANSYGVKWVELDVHLTKENIPVVYHDFYKKTNDSQKKTLIAEMNISDFYYSDNLISTNNIFNFTQKDLQYVSLEEVLKNSNGKCNFNVELKFPFVDEIESGKLKVMKKIPEYVNEVYKIVAKYCTSENAIFSSFHPEILIYLSLIQNKYDIHFIFEDKLVSNLKKIKYEDVSLCLAKRYGFRGIVADADLLDNKIEKFVRRYHNENLLVMLYGDKVNQLESIKNFFKNGVDGIITDNIKVAIEVLKSFDPI